MNAPCRIIRRYVAGALPTLLIAGLSNGIVMKAPRFRLPRPACHQGVYARLRRAMERVGVRGRFRKLKLATQSLRRGPLTRNLREERKFRPLPASGAR